MTYSVYQLPFEEKNNWYFRLAREALALQCPDVAVQPVPHGSLWMLLFRSRGASKRQVLHIHWSTGLYGSRFALLALFRMGMNALALSILTARGLRVVWTMHNAWAHDYPHPRIDALGRRLVGFFSHAIVVHEAATAVLVGSRYPNTIVRHIAHGNYCGEYPDPMPGAVYALRHKYGIADTDVVLLSIGMVRPYKQLDAVVRAFKKSATPVQKLLIVGKGDPRVIASLRRMAGDDPRIIIDPIFISNSDISAYLALARYAIFFYDDSELTSGALILALSYGVPAVIRSIPAAALIHPGENGFVFSDERDLERLLPTLPSSGLSKDAVLQSIQSTSWASSAKELCALYHSL